MLSSFLRAILTLHFTICATVFLIAGPLVALLFLVGFGYLWFFEGLAHVPILIIPAALALFVFFRLTIYVANKDSGFSVLAGLSPIVVFLVLAEVISYAAMRISFAGLENAACIFQDQSFTASLLQLIADADFLFGDTIRVNQHANAALSDESVLLWSYSELSFVSYEVRPGTEQRIPKRCFSD